MEGGVDNKDVPFDAIGLNQNSHYLNKKNAQLILVCAFFMQWVLHPCKR